MWCNEYNPDQPSILEGGIQIIETYMDVLNHAGNYCKGRESDYRFLIRAFAQARGHNKMGFRPFHDAKEPVMPSIGIRPFSNNHIRL